MKKRIVILSIFVFFLWVPYAFSKESLWIEGQIFPKNGVIDWVKIGDTVGPSVVKLFVSKAIPSIDQPQAPPKERLVIGTGFFINASGLILTAAHVAEHSTSIEIQLPRTGKERFKAKKIGIFKPADIALVQMLPKEIERFKAAGGIIKGIPWGNSDKIQPSEEILSLGYPLGIDELSKTKGIVSGIEKRFEINFIQTDAAFNPGNSGGPSVNSRGEVIGVNVAKNTKGENVGYIVPINYAKIIVPQLKKNKKAYFVSLDIIFQESNNNCANYFKAPRGLGVIITQVIKGGFGEQAGLKRFDILTAYNQLPIDYYGETFIPEIGRKRLKELIHTTLIGNEISLTIYRNGKKMEVKGKAQKRPSLPVPFRKNTDEPVDYQVFGGMVIQQLTHELIHYYRLKRYMSPDHWYEGRLIITHIFLDSEAYRSRILKKKNIIKKINNKKIHTLKELRELIQSKSFQHKRYVAIETENGSIAILNLKRIKAEEPILQKRYKYRPVPERKDNFN